MKKLSPLAQAVADATAEHHEARLALARTKLALRKAQDELTAAQDRFNKAHIDLVKALNAKEASEREIGE